MAKIDRAAVIASLEETGASRPMACQYADAFAEYREATDNIDTEGVLVLHPRTGNPIDNPYLKIRDRALKKLQSMCGVRADRLW